MQKFIISESESGQTLEKYIRKVLKDAPLSFIYKLFRKKDVKVNGHWQKEKYVLSSGEEVTIYITDDQLEEFKKKSKELSVNKVSEYIVYEDDNILILNKPRGVLVQKGSSDDEALDEMVISYLVEKGEYDPSKDLGYTPAPAHRLDRNTAGLIIFGKNIQTLRYLSSVIQDKKLVEKKYLTLVKGHVESDGEINSPLMKNMKTGMVYISDNGKDALTRYHVKEYVGDYTLLEVELLTGRTHQIRVHLSSIGHPVIGDSKYGDFELNKEIEDKYGFKNQFLVAYLLKFGKLDSPLNNLSNKSFKIDLPKELDDLRLKLGKRD